MEETPDLRLVHVSPKRKRKVRGSSAKLDQAPRAPDMRMIDCRPNLYDALELSCRSARRRRRGLAIAALVLAVLCVLLLVGLGRKLLAG